MSFKVTHAILAAITDVATYQLALAATRSREIAELALFCQLVSWFTFFGAARPFVNGLEAALTAVALWLWVDAVGRGRAVFRRVAAAGACAGLAIAARPTALIMWTFLAASTLHHAGLWRTTRLAAAAGGPALVALAAGAAVDRAFFGRWSFPLANFVRFNVVEGNDLLYGGYSPFWYAFDGVPAVCGVLLPFVALGLRRGWSERGVREVALSALWYVVVLSLAAHKEHRFLLPIAPAISVLAGRGLYSLQCWGSAETGGDEGEGEPLARRGAIHADRGGALAREATKGPRSTAAATGESPAAEGLRRRRRSGGGWAAWCRGHSFPAVLAFLVVANAAGALYLNLVHQRGAVDAARFLAAEAEAAASAAVVVTRREAPGTDGDLGHNCSSAEDGACASGGGGGPAPLSSLFSAHFLMPCHSAPFYAVVHAPVQLLQLDCSPPVRLATERGLTDALVHASSETAAWDANPARLLRALYGEQPEAPLACSSEVAPGRPPLQPPHAADLLRLHHGPSATRRINVPGEHTFATTAAAFLAEYGSDDPPRDASEAPPAGGSYRELPSHVVMYDTDAAAPPVAAFLDRHGYAFSHAFSQVSRVGGGVGAQSPCTHAALTLVS